MPLHISESEQFVFVNYHRKEFRDSAHLKHALGNQSSSLNHKDVIIDVSSCGNLTSPEIGSIARLLSDFQGTTRYVRIIANPEIIKSLKSTNITRMQQLILYGTREQFINEIKKAGGKSA